MYRLSQKIGSIAKQTPTPRLQGSATMMDALDHMDLCESDIIAVECEAAFVGVFRRHDFNRCVIRQHLNPNETTLYEVMTVNLPVVSPNATVREAYERMVLHKCEHMPVITTRTLYGIVALQDLGKGVIEAYKDLRMENRMILNYIQCGESYGLSNYY